MIINYNKRRKSNILKIFNVFIIQSWIPYQIGRNIITVSIIPTTEKKKQETYKQFCKMLR